MGSGVVDFHSFWDQQAQTILPLVFCFHNLNTYICIGFGADKQILAPMLKAPDGSFRTGTNLLRLSLKRFAIKHMPLGQSCAAIQFYDSNRKRLDTGT